ncbi:hypothetical protein [Cytobacillus firmus]|uniref:hypothetical protein n=1 Tax=Cytobacillus firmus TaxID=1399 RepID=UPI00222848C9|nr:hypothetical protein [Cytobacillus firmus]
MVDTGSGEERAGSGRTSKSMAFRLKENQLVERIETRIAELAGIRQKMAKAFRS